MHIYDNKNFSKLVCYQTFPAELDPNFYLTDIGLTLGLGVKVGQIPMQYFFLPKYFFWLHIWRGADKKDD